MHERATPPRPAGAQPDATRVQILATEHWSLLATRSMGYNEIFDERGILQSWGPLAHTRNSRILSSTPTIVGVVNAVVAGVVSGLIAEVAGAPPVGSILIGAAATGLAVALAVRFALGNIRLLRSSWEPRFPHPVENERAPS